MDNVTHSLVGVVFAKSTEANKKYISPAAFWTAVIASNLPDADIFLNRFGARSKFNYLLHHRGYTHTLLAAIPLAFLSVVMVLCLRKIFARKEQDGSDSIKFDAKKWLNLSIIAIACVLLHLGLDFLNDYGVHVFSPFFNRWFYGDVLFIVDPYIWLCLIPFAYFQVRNRFARGMWVVLAVGMLAVLWLGSYAAWGVAAASSIWAVSSFFVQKKAAPVRALQWAAASLTLVIAFAASCSHFAQVQVRNALPARADTSPAPEIVLTPAPANPLCWRVWVSEFSPEQNAFVSRLGVVSLAPMLTASETCDPGIALPRTATLSAPDLLSTAAIFWKGNSMLKREEFQRLKQTSCQFRNFLKFARVPFVASHDGKIIIGDLRYDRSPDLGFAEMVLLPDPTGGCKEDYIPWEEPFLRETVIPTQSL